MRKINVIINRADILSKITQIPILQTFNNLQDLSTMSSLDFQYMLGNLSFACLLAMVVWYWLKLTFSLTPLLAPVGTFGMATANLSLAGLLLARWFTSGHFPLSNLYESLLFLSWGFTAFHLIMEITSRSDFFGIVTSPVALLTDAFASFSLPKEMQKTTALVPALQSNWLMMHVTVMMISYVALISGSLLAVAFLVVNYYDRKTLKKTPPSSLSFEEDASQTSMESGDRQNLSSASLQLQPIVVERGNAKHFVTLGQTSHASQGNTLVSLTEAETLPPRWPGMANEPQEHFAERAPSQRNFVNQLTIDPSFSSQHLAIATDAFSPFAQTLDNLSYRTLGLGFPLLTIGILSGAVWANEAWGSYWSWDPKETWALITWLVFAIYLHTRLSKGWRGSKPALIAVAGFFVVWICYLGVNLIGTGLHSYGWFQARG